MEPWKGGTGGSREVGGKAASVVQRRVMVAWAEVVTR